MTKARAIVIKDSDNVATVVQPIKAGATISFAVNGNQVSLKILDNIPFGHKFAIRDIAAGRPVVKYGETIGGATVDIKAGQHAHVHNVESLRGRGDKD